MKVEAFEENTNISTPVEQISSSTKKQISWKNFQQKYLTREDGYTYEWLNGKVEKTKRTMNYTQFFILRNLQRFFRKLFIEEKVDGELITEGDIFFGKKEKNHRKPDVAWLSDEQIDKMAFGENQVPEFVIEIISTTDGINRFNRKMIDYREANVKVVWKIHPETKEIHVYSGKQLKKIKVCIGKDICSASPVLPDFVLSTNDILKMPEKPVTK